MSIRFFDLYPYIGKFSWDIYASDIKIPVLSIIPERASGDYWPVMIRGEDTLIRLRDLLNQEFPPTRPEDMEVL